MAIKYNISPGRVETVQVSVSSAPIRANLAGVGDSFATADLPIPDETRERLVAATAGLEIKKTPSQVFGWLKNASMKTLPNGKFRLAQVFTYRAFLPECHKGTHD
jgi:hypothetical protein